MTLDIEAMKASATNATYLGGETQEQADNVLALIAEVERLQALTTYPKIEQLPVSSSELKAHFEVRLSVGSDPLAESVIRICEQIEAVEKPYESARFRIAGRHHMFSDERGTICLCRERTGTNRGFTEHVIDEFINLLEREKTNE